MQDLSSEGDLGEHPTRTLSTLDQCHRPRKTCQHPSAFSLPRMVVYSGRTNTSALLYDSLRTESVPFEGLLSEGSSIRIEFTSDQGQAASAFNIRFEGERSPPCLVSAKLEGPRLTQISKTSFQFYCVYINFSKQLLCWCLVLSFLPPSFIQLFTHSFIHSSLSRGCLKCRSHAARAGLKLNKPTRMTLNF